MKKLKLSILFFLILAGCNVYVLKCPLPGSANYPYSVSTIPGYSSVVYIAPGSCYPGKEPGDVSTSGPQVDEGAFFIFQDKIIYARYDSKTGTYLPQQEYQYQNIQTASSVEGRTAMIVGLKNDKTDSLLFSIACNINGQAVNRKTVAKFIIDRVNKKMIVHAVPGMERHG